MKIVPVLVPLTGARADISCSGWGVGEAEAVRARDKARMGSSKENIVRLMVLRLSERIKTCVRSEEVD